MIAWNSEAVTWSIEENEVELIYTKWRDVQLLYRVVLSNKDLNSITLNKTQYDRQLIYHRLRNNLHQYAEYFYFLSWSRTIMNIENAWHYLIFENNHKQNLVRFCEMSSAKSEIDRTELHYLWNQRWRIMNESLNYIKTQSQFWWKLWAYYILLYN